MSMPVKAWSAIIGVGIMLYGAAVFYAWKFALTGSEAVFLSTYALGCGLAALGAAGLSFALIKSKYPDLTVVAALFATLLFACVAAGMFYGMLYW